MDKRKLVESPLKLEIPGIPRTVVDQRAKIFKSEILELRNSPSKIENQEIFNEDVFDLAGFDEEIFEEVLFVIQLYSLY